MMYKKPDDVTYTEMAIFIDAHAYDNPSTEEVDTLIFEYLFHLISMVAYKARLFSKYQYYEDFSLYAATEIFMRLKNPRQFQYDKDGNPKLKQIKSILNYIKKMLYPKKVDFEQTYYDQTFSHETLNVDTGIGYTFNDTLIDSIDSIENVDFNLCLGDVVSTIKSYIYSLPFKKDKTFTLNLYLSCLLTFLSTITPRTLELNRIRELKLSDNKKFELIEQLYHQFTLDDVILYHLDETYTQYVFLLTKVVKHLVANDLSFITHTQIQSESSLKSMLVNSVLDTAINQEGD